MATSTVADTAKGLFRRFTAGGWYFLVVIASLGILTPVPFAHAATRLREGRLWAATVGYAAVVAVTFVLFGLSPRDAAGQSTGVLSSVGVVLALGLMLGGCVHLVGVRRRAFGLPTTPARASVNPHAADPAVAAALAVRARRAQARQLAADDPLLARELRIGRPDLTRDYDDGGLVDLNTAPTRAISEVCEIAPHLAQQLVDLRGDQDGTWTGVDDVFAYLDVPVSAWDRIRDRALVITAATR